MLEKMYAKLSGKILTNHFLKNSFFINFCAIFLNEIGIKAIFEIENCSPLRLITPSSS